MNISSHYPRDLTNLLVQAIPALCNSKNDILGFFRYAEVEEEMLRDIAANLVLVQRVISKYEITRLVLDRLNQAGQAALGQRRQILKQIIEFNQYHALNAANRQIARNLVGEVQAMVHVKDNRTREQQEKDRIREIHIASQEAKLTELNRQKNSFATIKRELNGVFGITDQIRRGRALEAAFNSLFKASEIIVKEPITLYAGERPDEPGLMEGVIVLDDHPYLIEIKWHSHPLCRADISQNLVNLFSREATRGFFFSNTGYTFDAIELCKLALGDRKVALCTLEEIVLLLEQEQDFAALLKEKMRQAVVNRNPFWQSNGYLQASGEAGPVRFR